MARTRMTCRCSTIVRSGLIHVYNCPRFGRRGPMFVRSPYDLNIFDLSALDHPGESPSGNDPNINVVRDPTPPPPRPLTPPTPTFCDIFQPPNPTSPEDADSDVEFLGVYRNTNWFDQANLVYDRNTDTYRHAPPPEPTPPVPPNQEQIAILREQRARFTMPPHLQERIDRAQRQSRLLHLVEGALPRSAVEDIARHYNIDNFYDYFRNQDLRMSRTGDIRAFGYNLFGTMSHFHRCLRRRNDGDTSSSSSDEDDEEQQEGAFPEEWGPPAAKLPKREPLAEQKPACCPVCLIEYGVPKLLRCCARSICAECEKKTFQPLPSKKNKRYRQWTRRKRVMVDCPVCFKRVRKHQKLVTNVALKNVVDETLRRRKRPCPRCKKAVSNAYLFRCNTCKEEGMFCSKCGLEQHNDHDVKPVDVITAAQVGTDVVMADPDKPGPSGLSTLRI
ncbi:hypothetical protein QR680_004155 [Steinernema hermaphroditum]|uniref:Uncharacterized protein n=1 Tax=Steinernema hermaphroditum TaxID=289476 RepID=A0AA39LT73_9BILA|nr:hypothetical protein QR680_004155 [Steinernema hermaphroditum]